jgi:hypothetical protein
MDAVSAIAWFMLGVITAGLVNFALILRYLKS